ncbi:venom carboxylesterase-6-like [Limulus polyphemus]|uniref:Venom carboxylesterase-6-like n=1 Tax=Limulus polyphemus TaxID=6850 RepID=A0ABM1TDZ0_LIMPO|nr:venom carboxylesterase-6-like [Limulus polyphemus]
MQPIYVILISFGMLIFCFPAQPAPNNSHQMHDALEHIIHTTKGYIRGKRLPRETMSGKTIYAFKGIPFAKPPVNDLRFKPPEEIQSWFGVRDAKEHEAFCPQVHINSEAGFVTRGVEDCLYLDVYCRQLPDKHGNNPGHPVVVYFHGGKFKYGGKDLYGPKLLLDLELILVIVNYRLGIFGFLSTDDEEAPGNFGLKDQQMALKWVKENIQFFGGDPAKVTVFGHDAGGASVTFHIVSESSRGYFTRAVVASGTGFAPWAVTSNPRQHAQNAAFSLGCQPFPSSGLLHCLRQKSVEALLEIQAKSPNSMFLPVIEKNLTGAMLTDHPYQMYSKGLAQNVHLLAGITEKEASLDFYALSTELQQCNSSDDILEYLLRPYFQPHDDLSSIITAVKFHYFQNIQLENLKSSFTRLIDMLSDFFYNAPNDLAVNLHSGVGNPTWMCVFDSISRHSKHYLSRDAGESIRNYGFPHYDIALRSNNSHDSNVPKSITPDEYSRIKKWIQIIHNFAEKGDPGFGIFPKWKPFVTNKHAYYHFRNVSPYYTLHFDYRQHHSDFWNVLVPDLLHSMTSTIRNLEQNLEEPSLVKSEYKTAAWGMVAMVLILFIMCVALIGVVVTNRKRRIWRAFTLISSSFQDISQLKHEKEHSDVPITF